MGGGYGRNVLVVTTTDSVPPSLQRHLRDDDTVKLVVPVVGQGLLDWLSNDEKAFAAADETAAKLAEDLPGETVDSSPGEDDVGLAIRDALADFPADEIVVAIVADDADRIERSLAAERTREGRTIDGIPVRVVTTAAPEG